MSSFLIRDVLPDPLKNSPLFAALAEAFVGPHTDINNIFAAPLQAIRAEYVSEPDAVDFLRYMAWLYQADKFREGLTPLQMRTVLQEVFRFHQRRGTVGAVEELLQWFGYTAHVYEGGNPSAFLIGAIYRFDDIPADAQPLDQYAGPIYYDPDLKPYEFGVVVEGSEAGSDLAEIQTLIAQTQNVRSHLKYIRFTLP